MMNGPSLTDKNKTLLHFPEDFKETLELLVLKILRERPNDPLEFASNFFLKKLQSRQESNANVDEFALRQQETQRPLSELQENKCCQMSETQAASIIQSYFRAYNTRQNRWKKRFLVTKLTDHNHLNTPLILDSRKESFSLCWSGNEDVYLNYDSDNSLENLKF